MGQTYQRLIVFILLLQIPVLLAQNREFEWKKKSHYNESRIESALGFSLGQKGYVCLETVNNSPFKSCWQYDPIEDKWQRLSDFAGEARKWATVFTIGERAYVATGLDGATKGMNDLWEYNPATDTWTKKAEFPGEGRYMAIGFSIGDKGYVGLGSKVGGFKYFNDLWEYDPKKDQWTKKADFPEKGRIDASVFVIENRAYVLLGGQFLKVTASNTDVWEYNPKVNKWEKKNNFPGSARLGATAFSINDRGYIYAGYNGVNTRYEDFWEYHATSNSWKQISDTSADVRINAFCFVIDSTAFIGTGIKQAKSVDLVGDYNNYFWCVSSSPGKINVDYNAKLLYQDKNQKLPLSQQGVSLISEEKKIIQVTTTDASGSFAFKQIDKKGKYQVVLDKNDKLPANASVAIAQPSGKIIQNLEKNANGQFSYEISNLDLLEEEDSYFNLQYFMKSSDKEVTITKNIYYPAASWELSEEAGNMLYQVIVSLNQYPELIIEISSHTDAKGSDEENLQLSEKRAQTVVEYILFNNIDSKRVSGKGFGEAKILNRCKNGVDCSEQEHKVNRRTEFKFIKTQ